MRGVVFSVESVMGHLQYGHLHGIRHLQKGTCKEYYTLQKGTCNDTEMPQGQKARERQTELAIRAIAVYGVATVSRIDKIIGLFCRISSLL